jgi:hypothetical protein
MPFRPYSSHPQLSSSHLFSSRLIRSMFGTKHRSSSETSTRHTYSKEKMYASRKPHACNVYQDQPTDQTSLAHAKRKRKSETQPKPDRLQMHQKNKQPIHLFEGDASYLFDSLVIDESVGHQSIQIKEIYAIVDPPCLCHDFLFSPFLLFSYQTLQRSNVPVEHIK